MTLPPKEIKKNQSKGESKIRRTICRRYYGFVQKRELFRAPKHIRTSVRIGKEDKGEWLVEEVRQRRLNSQGQGQQNSKTKGHDMTIYNI